MYPDYCAKVLYANPASARPPKRTDGYIAKGTSRSPGGPEIAIAVRLIFTVKDDDRVLLPLPVVSGASRKMETRAYSGRKIKD